MHSIQAPLMMDHCEHLAPNTCLKMLCRCAWIFIKKSKCVEFYQVLHYDKLY